VGDRPFRGWCPYRGYPPVNPSQIKPDLITVKLIATQALQNQPPQNISRDFLWIECKAASEDKPHSWKNVLNEATTRLQIAHSTQLVFLMIAIGWTCIAKTTFAALRDEKADGNIFRHFYAQRLHHGWWTLRQPLNFLQISVV